MEDKLKLTNHIDKKNNQFTSSVKNELNDLTQFSEQALEWLMMEHYQFSFNNTRFLHEAMLKTSQFKEAGVVLELQRNLEEEKSHAAIYKNALKEIGTNVETRLTFDPTRDFFAKIKILISACPSGTLGTMYATETAAIFEHEVFWRISRDVMNRRNLTWEKSRLKLFHDMHLSGVEQGHKDGLGVFVDMAHNDHTVDENSIEESKVIAGAELAIDAMVAWWRAMLDQARKMSIVQ